MATQQVIDDFTSVFQSCLESKLQASFDANAALTLDIAREVAEAVEAKANDYTDIEINKVLQLITNGDVDLGPFTEFMNSVKTLLDGDENTEGYQIFEQLVTDTATNKQSLININTSLSLITQTLNTFQTTLDDHEQRIADLEAAQHEPVNCEDCHDAILNLVKDSIAAACAAAGTANEAYYTQRHNTLLSAFAQEIDPISVSCEYSFDEATDVLEIFGTFSGRKIEDVVVDVVAEVDGYVDGMVEIADQQTTFNRLGKSWSWVFPGDKANAWGRTIRAKARKAGGVESGFTAEVTLVEPAAEGGDGNDGGDGTDGGFI